MPTIAAPTVVTLITSARTMPVPMVAATAVPDIVPATFKAAASSSAFPGLSTLVETTVAIALGASVQPFTNSAARMSASTNNVPAAISGMDA
jgi:hypothetical protein